jgi:hypothetical protein
MGKPLEIERDGSYLRGFALSPTFGWGTTPSRKRTPEKCHEGEGFKKASKALNCRHIGQMEGFFLGGSNRTELDGEMGDSHMGVQARLMSQAMRKLTGTVSKSNTCLIFINQIRDKIGVIFGKSRNHHRWPCAEVLFIDSPGYPAHRRY